MDFLIELETLNCSQEESLRSVEAQTSTVVEFMNRSSGHIQIYWIDYTGQRVLYNILWPDECYQQKTYLTQPWLIIDSMGECRHSYLPDEQSGSVVASDASGTGWG